MHLQAEGALVLFDVSPGGWRTGQRAAGGGPWAAERVVWGCSPQAANPQRAFSQPALATQDGWTRPEDLGELAPARMPHIVRSQSSMVGTWAVPTSMSISGVSSV